MHAIHAAGKGRGGVCISSVSLLLFIFRFFSCPSRSSTLLSLLSLISLSLRDDTKWSKRVDMSLNPNTIKIKSPRKTAADPAGFEPATSWSPVGQASNWATEAGKSALTRLTEGMNNWTIYNISIYNEIIRMRCYYDLPWSVLYIYAPKYHFSHDEVHEIIFVKHSSRAYNVYVHKVRQTWMVGCGWTCSPPKLADLSWNCNTLTTVDFQLSKHV